MGVNPSFWSGKKVFITGHTGFKGSWLSLWLQHLGADVTGYALHPPTNPSLFEVAQVAQGMKSVIGDIRNATLLTNVIQQTSPDIVIHMAAQPLVRRSYIDPVETYSTNVMGTVYLLEAVRRTQSVRAVLNVTSDKCYENNNLSCEYRESDPMGGFDPYSSSKACSELVTSAYRNSFFSIKENCDYPVSLATARAGNVIGGGDWAPFRLIPDIIRAIEKGQSVCIRNPQAIRPWQHVLEPLSGYLILTEKLWTDGCKFSEPFNFGPLPEDARCVEWIVDKMVTSWGNGASWRIKSDNVHESNCLKLDISNTITKLGWRPRLNLELALQSILNWHNSYLEGENMNHVTLRQIAWFSDFC